MDNKNTPHTPDRKKRFQQVTAAVLAAAALVQMVSVAFRRPGKK